MDIKNYGIKGVGDNVQLGKRGPKLKNSSGDIQARNAADSAFAPVGVATPTAPEHATTKAYVDGTAGDVLYRQVTVNFNSTSPLNIGTAVPATAKVQQVKVQVNTAWDSTVTTLAIDDGTNVLMATTENDLAETGTYISERLGGAVVAGTQLRAVFSGGSPTAGTATVFVAYTK